MKRVAILFYISPILFQLLQTGVENERFLIPYGKNKNIALSVQKKIGKTQPENIDHGLAICF
jgi:hypothetical protein